MKLRYPIALTLLVLLASVVYFSHTASAQTCTQSTEATGCFSNLEVISDYSCVDNSGSTCTTCPTGTVAWSCSGSLTWKADGTTTQCSSGSSGQGQYLCFICVEASSLSSSSAGSQISPSCNGNNGGGGSSLTLSFTSPITSPTSDFFTASCSKCNSEIYIFDYGSNACPSSEPAGGDPAYNLCSSIAAGSSSACMIGSAAGPGTATGSPAYTGSGTDNICAYSYDTSGPEFASGQLLVNPTSCATPPCSSGSTNPNPAIAAICNVYTAVNVIVFILALTLMILGGALYAGAQILPGSSRGMVQGYAMGLVLGGVAGAIIAMIAPFVLSIAYNSPINTIVGVCGG
ncbi:MAG: hypothetical protein ACHQX1_00630 [Candidatus Micrarchaeales archaeon]